MVELVEVPGNGRQKDIAPKSVQVATGKTVQDLPEIKDEIPPLSDFVLFFATVADAVPAWGKSVPKRDAELRKFWPTEPYLASAVYSTVIRNAGFTFRLDGPPRTVKQLQRNIFDFAHFGKGWLYFIIKFGVDLLTQDNAAFIELIRLEKKPSSPVVGIANLDSFRCQRTGDPNWPVIYTDRLGARHKLANYQVVSVEELPSPVDTMHGVQYSAVTRVLRAAQILREIGVYKNEKVSGRFHRAIHLVSGIGTKQVEDAMAQSDIRADNRGQTRYNQPLVLGSIDPTANVDHVQIDLASLPDAFDEETTLKWYIAALATGFGGDYQDFAPLPGGNLGSAQQSEILHRKTRGKGPAMFMKLIEHTFNTYILPSNVKLVYEEQDLEAAQEQARLKGIRGKERAERLKSGEITPKVAQMQALADGDLTDEEFELLEKQAQEAKRAEEEAAQSELEAEQLEPRRRDDPSMERELE